MDYQKIASIAAPSLTPLAPAAVLMQGLHDGLVLSGMNTGMAWIPAASSGIGMELTGFLASKMTVRALKMGDGVSFFLAALGIVGYVAFAVIGIQRVPNADMFQAFVGMSTIAYFAYGVYEWMTTKDEKKNKAAADTLKIEDDKRKSEIEYNEQMAALEKGRAESEHRAKLDEIRLAKLTTNQNGNLPKVSETFRTDWRNLPNEDKARVKGQSTRWIMETFLVSERTALNWSKNAEAVK